MVDERAIAALLLGVLLYKSLELVVIYQKLLQTIIRGGRLTPGSRPLNTFWAGLVSTLQREFVTIANVYLWAVMVLLGLLLIFEESRTVKGAFLQAQAISLVTVLASIFTAFLNIAVERYRTLIEQG